MSVSIQDIAEKAKVSAATVSRVLNYNDPRISDATKKRVLEIAEQMQYRPNRIARALATGRTGIIGVWAYYIHPSFYSNVLISAQETVRRDDYDALVIDTGSYKDPKSFDNSRLLHWPVDGVLAFDNFIFVEQCIRQGIVNVPIVSMGIHITKITDWVFIDVSDAALEAARYLVNKGRKRIAYMAPSRIDVSGYPRHDAYDLVMRESGLKPEKILTQMHGKGAERSHARDCIKDYVREHGCPEAILCYNDEIAIGCCRGLQEMSIAIPDDVNVIGFDGIQDTEYLNPPLSTIVHPIEEMCAIAWQFLKQRISDPTLPIQSAVLKSKLEIRESA